MTIDMADQTALVTGAGSGIGEACARCLAAAGAFVWVNDINADQAARVAREIGGEPLVGDVGAPDTWLNPAIERGVLHTLVHNAGYDLTTRVGTAEMADFERLIRVQLTGPFDITQRLLAPLKAAGGAVVIYIASVHAQATNSGMSAYAAAKGGQVAMVNSMALDLGKHRIRALAVSPGFVDTALMAEWVNSTDDPEATKAEADSLHPMGRIGTPEDVGCLVTFLASKQAEFINATNIVIDGGLTTKLF